MTALRPCAMVTGGAKRVGLAIARRFAHEGFDLVLTCHRSGHQASSAADELRAAGAAVRLEPLDLNAPAEVEAAAQRLARELPRLDVLVHNASIYTPTPLESVTAEEALRNYRVHGVAPLLITRHLAPLLARSACPGGGAVIAMTDLHATGRPRKGFVAYSMSKAALAEMVRSLARDLAPNVRVNGIAPGVIAWPESGRDSDEAMQQAYLSRVPLQRAGTPEDAAEAVFWLATRAAYTTGQILRLDGGRSLT